jgi:hypothetical protein
MLWASPSTSPQRHQKTLCVPLDIKQQKNQRKCIDVSYLKQEGAVNVLEIQIIPFSQSSAKLLALKTTLELWIFFFQIFSY